MRRKSPRLESKRVKLDRKRKIESKDSRPAKRKKEIPRRGLKRTLSQPSYPEKKRQITCEGELNYDEDLKTKEEMSRDEIKLRENAVVTGFEIVPYRPPCKSIVAYESKTDLAHFLSNRLPIEIPVKPPSSLITPCPPMLPSEKYLRALNKSEIKIEDDPMDLHSESSMDGDYSMEID